MRKIKTLKQIAKIAAGLRKKGKTVGLITGCFDVVHASHVDLFRFAKKHCDLVIIGLDSDETIKINKGLNRPIHNISQRERVLSELLSVDLIFENKEKLDWGKEQTEKIHEQIFAKIKPNYLITNPLADRLWKLKEQQAKRVGAKLLKNVRKKDLSSTQIIKFFAREM